ncbi:MAG: hypothetical protein JWQ98_1406 [Chlorobi bacterium]|nr:hypothetical protein [Chlorobiota bacterium]
MKTWFNISIACLLLGLAAGELHAGGPWAAKKGKGRLTFGYSRKTAGQKWYGDGSSSTTPDDSLLDGKFHDFRYGYLSGEVGLFDHLELSGTLLYLWGYEKVGSNPKTGKPIPFEWELNSGFTDAWLNLKYQFLEGEYPMAAMVSSRFPDLYDEPGPYTRYVSRFYTTPISTKTVDGRDSTFLHKDTAVVASNEWRGLLKRDFGIHLLAGHSFGAEGYIEGELGYNFRQGAFADQLLFSIDGGYNIAVTNNLMVTPKLLFDYTGGVGNGNLPDSSDRFNFRVANVPQANFYFNNSKYGRLYGSAIISYDDHYGLELGVGKWIFGSGAAKYTELYGQFSYSF